MTGFEPGGGEDKDYLIWAEGAQNGARMQFALGHLVYFPSLRPCISFLCASFVTHIFRLLRTLVVALLVAFFAVRAVACRRCSMFVGVLSVGRTRCVRVSTSTSRAPVPLLLASVLSGLGVALVSTRRCLAARGVDLESPPFLVGAFASRGDLARFTCTDYLFLLWLPQHE